MLVVLENLLVHFLNDACAPQPRGSPAGNHLILDQYWHRAAESSPPFRRAWAPEATRTPCLWRGRLPPLTPSPSRPSTTHLRLSLTRSAARSVGNDRVSSRKERGPQ